MEFEVHRVDQSPPKKTHSKMSIDPSLMTAPNDVHSEAHSPSITDKSQASSQEYKQETRKRTRKYGDSVLWFMKDQWFLIALGLLILLSSQVQVPESGQHTKEVVVTYLCVAIIFFITGCTLSTRVLLDNYSRWKLHLFVQVQCFLMTSATTFGIVSATATNHSFMDPWLLIGFIFMGCVPTTISSNVVMTRQAGGNTALTVVQSTIGNFLGPFLTPALVSMYTSTGAWYTQVLPDDTGGYGEIYRRVFKQLGLSLFLPMFVGQVFQNIFPAATKKVFTNWKLSKLASVALLLVVWQTFDQAFQTGAFGSAKGSNIVFIVFVSIGLWMLWLGVCFVTSMLWLPKGDVISVAYCIPAKTPAMGVPLSTVMFVGISTINESKIQIPMVIFQGFQIAFGSLLTMAFRKWVERDDVNEKRNDEEPGASQERH